MQQAEKRLNGRNLGGDIICDSTTEWRPPCSGWVKLNIDRACSLHSSLGCGGIIQNCEGFFLVGFMFYPITGDGFTAEL